MSATSSRPHAPVAQSLSARRRLLDEAAAQLVAAWDTDLEARAPGDAPLPNTRPSADARRAHSAIVSTSPPSTPVAEVPTLSVKLPTDVSSLDGLTLPARLSLPESVRRRWPWALGALGLILTLIVWGASGGGEESPAVAAATPQQGTAQENASDGIGPGAQDTQPTAPAQVRHTLVVRTIPPDASLRIDGVAVDNPYSAEHTPDETLHLMATAEGHKPAERDLSLTEDVNLMITLSPDAKAQRPEVGSKPNARPKRAKQTARKRRARRPKARSEQPKARKRPAKKGSAGFVSSNPYL